MTSPFPGMDPFIEASGLWEDFHNHLIEGAYQSLADQAPPGYMVRTGERTYVVLAEGGRERERLYKPDVSVHSAPPFSSSGPVAVAERRNTETENAPVTMRALIEETFRETFIEIRRAKGDQELVTAIEILSPTNKKPGTKRRQEYLEKRQAFLLGAANFIEVDLLRGGERMPMHDPWPDSPYYLLVARRDQAPICQVWPAFSHRPLPTIPVPLASPDPDLSLDVQPLIQAIFKRSRYLYNIDYSRSIPFPLSSVEQDILAHFHEKSESRAE